MFWTECALKLVVSTSNIFTNPKVALETVTVLHQLSWLQTHKQKHMISLYKVSFWSHSQKHQKLNLSSATIKPYYARSSSSPVSSSSTASSRAVHYDSRHASFARKKTTQELGLFWVQSAVHISFSYLRLSMSFLNDLLFFLPADLPIMAQGLCALQDRFWLHLGYKSWQVYLRLNLFLRLNVLFVESLWLDDYDLNQYVCRRR